MMNRRDSIAAFCSIAIFAPLLWMVMDRDPPHIRYDGAITAAPAGACGSDVNSGVEPGGCAQVEWKIIRLRSCRPSSNNSTTRVIRDAAHFPWTIGPVRTVLGHSTDDNVLVRSFIIPSGATPGPAIYDASACFACNPLQYGSENPISVCVSKPSINFEITPKRDVQ